jgi:Na+-transporting NADH:ubiquinone oxidoreductase subunit C
VADFDKEGLKNVLLVAIGVCLVCSIMVSTAAVVLRPAQAANKELDRKENILRAAGLLGAGQHSDASGRGVDELFKEFEVRAVDLDSGRYVDTVDVARYEPVKASRDPQASRRLTSEEDVATIIRRENVSLVYLRSRDGVLDKVVLPVRGYGLWGTLYGYLALEGDLETVAAMSTRLDASRMSSVFGLNDSPQTAMTFPAKAVPKWRLILSASTCFWREFTSSIARSISAE